MLALNYIVKAAMKKFTEKIVWMMKAEKLFQTQGGPIILAQVCFIHLLLFVTIKYHHNLMIKHGGLKLKDFLDYCVK